MGSDLELEIRMIKSLLERNELLRAFGRCNIDNEEDLKKECLLKERLVHLTTKD